jgi:hypothetical protein
MTIQKYDLEVVSIGWQDLVEREHGEWVRYADIQQPAPWLDRPDGSGWWYRLHLGTTTIVRLEFNPFDGGRLSEKLSDFYQKRVDQMDCLWQRIPDAVPPKTLEPK